MMMMKREKYFSLIELMKKIRILMTIFIQVKENVHVFSSLFT